MLYYIYDPFSPTSPSTRSISVEKNDSPLASFIHLVLHWLGLPIILIGMIVSLHFGWFKVQPTPENPNPEVELRLEDGK